MNTKDLSSAVRVLFKTQIQDTNDGLPVEYDNMTFDQEPDPTKVPLWVRFTVLPGERQQVQLPNWFRTPGVAIAQVFSPAGKGDAAAKDLIGAIMLAFQTKTVSNVKYLVPYEKTVGRSGSWWQINVNCPFYSDASS